MVHEQMILYYTMGRIVALCPDGQSALDTTSQHILFGILRARQHDTTCCLVRLKALAPSNS